METIDNIFKDLIPKIAPKNLALIWGEKIVITEDYVYPNTVTVLRPGKGKMGVKMTPQYVVVHDTGMTNPEDNAWGLSRFIHGNANNDTGRVASWHFSLDDKDCLMHVPTDEIAWHAGDGSAAFGSTYYNKTYKVECIGGGNQNGIAIESCINPGNDYSLTIMRLARLVAELLKKYNLPMDRIKQHYDFSGKNCPNVIRATDGLWETFLIAAKAERALLDFDEESKVYWEISHPEIISRNGEVRKVLKDTEVDLTLHLESKKQKIKYKYTTLVKGLSEEERIKRTYNELISSVIPQVITKDITLLDKHNLYNVKLDWKSLNEDILSQEGKYNKPHKKTVINLEVNLSTENKRELFKIELITN